MTEDHIKRFIDGYITAALWSSTDDRGESLDLNYNDEDLSKDARREAEKDCRDFIAKASALLQRATDRVGYTWARAGHDLWLSRNGHGAGYWDRTELYEGGLGEALHRLCARKNVDIYVGDDKALHFSGFGAFS